MDLVFDQNVDLVCRLIILKKGKGMGTETYGFPPADLGFVSVAEHELCCHR